MVPNATPWREGYTYVEIRGKYRIPMHQLLERRKKKECGRRQIHPEGDNKRDPSFIHLPSGEQAGDGEVPTGH